MKLLVRHTTKHDNPTEGQYRALVANVPVLMAYGETKEKAIAQVLSMLLALFGEDLQRGLKTTNDIFPLEIEEEESEAMFMKVTK